jgi:hypothetical protein
MHFLISGVVPVGEPVRGGPFPILHVTWQQDLIPLTASAVHDRLLHGKPSIQVRDYCRLPRQWDPLTVLNVVKRKSFPRCFGPK